MKKKPKEHCNNTLTEAGFRSYIMSGLRSKSRFWKPKSVAISKTFVKKGKNPETGKMCKLHECPECKGLFPQGKMDADHIEPVIPLEGFPKLAETFLGYNWTEVIKRLFCEADGYKVLCKECHAKKTKAENSQRRANKLAKQ